jgi:hypothetical protein
VLLTLFLSLSLLVFVDQVVMVHPVNPDLDEAELHDTVAPGDERRVLLLNHASQGKQIVSVALYLSAIPAAYYKPAASLARIGAVSILWLLPPKVDVPQSRSIR